MIRGNQETLAHTVSQTCDRIRLAGESCLPVRTTRTPGAQNRCEERHGQGCGRAEPMTLWAGSTMLALHLAV